MKVLIVKNAYSENLSQKTQALRISEEFKNLGNDAEIKENFNLAKISEGKVYAEKYDCCVFLDKDKVAARLLEKSGMRLFNSAAAIEVCDDKMLTHIALANKGFNMPDCIYAPLCYSEGQKPDEKFISSVQSSLGYPLVGKTCYGSLGAGVELIKDYSQLYGFEQRNIMQPHFYQKFINCGVGEDTRVLVAGGKYVCAMKRRNESDFRSNVAVGGHGIRVEADGELISLCERIAAELSLDFCGIDVLTALDGTRYVCEVNSNAFFAAAEEVCKVNVAKAFALHVANTMKVNK